MLSKMLPVKSIFKLIIGTLFLFKNILVYSKAPLWVFTPLTPTTLTVPINQSVLIEYQVNNQSAKSHKLSMQPIPGISQSSSCILSPSGTMGDKCILSLIITGGALPKNGISGGPKLCQTNSDGKINLNQCYIPSKANSLQINVGKAQYSLGGAVSNLTSGTLILQNNSSNPTSISTNGPFAFSIPVTQGTPYDVTVQTQPLNQTCTVTNGTGIMANSNVTNIQVNCVVNTHEYYILNYYGNTISVLNDSTDTITHTITVGNQPQSIVFNASGTRAYVANGLSNTLSIIDTASHSVIRTINGIIPPTDILLTPDESKLYLQPDIITNPNSGIQVITLRDNNVSTIPIQSSTQNGSISIALSPDGNTLYAKDWNIAPDFFGSVLYPTISIINTNTDSIVDSLTLDIQFSEESPFLCSSEVLNVQTGFRIAITPDGKYLIGYPPTSICGYNFYVVELKTNTVTSLYYNNSPDKVGLGSSPLYPPYYGDIIISPDSSQVYINIGAIPSDDSLPITCTTDITYFYNLNTQSFSSPSQSMYTCSRVDIYQAIFNPIKGIIYSMPAYSTVFEAFDFSGNLLPPFPYTVPISGQYSYAIVSADGNSIYITNSDRNQIVKIDATNGQLLNVVAENVGPEPSKIVLKPS